MGKPASDKNMPTEIKGNPNVIMLLPRFGQLFLSELCSAVVECFVLSTSSNNNLTTLLPKDLSGSLSLYIYISTHLDAYARTYMVAIHSDPPGLSHGRIQKDCIFREANPFHRNGWTAGLGGKCLI